MHTRNDEHIHIKHRSIRNNHNSKKTGKFVTSQGKTNLSLICIGCLKGKENGALN